MLPPISDAQPVPADADARWVEAEELLSGTPTDAARWRLVRAHRRRVLVVAGLVLVLGALAVPIGFLVADVDGGDTSTDVPLWQAVVGFVLMTAGLAGGFVAVARQIRTGRRAWRGPRFALTGRQRRELHAQIRGRAPVDPARVGLTRELAEGLLLQQNAVCTNTGLGVLWIGQAVAVPSWWRVGVAVGFILLVAVGSCLVQRDLRAARASLVAHPDLG